MSHDERFLSRGSLGHQTRWVSSGCSQEPTLASFPRGSRGWCRLHAACWRYRSHASLLVAQGSLGAVHSRRSEEHTSELQSLMRISYAVFCLKKKTTF